MGWTSFKFSGTIREFVEQEFNREPAHGKVLKFSQVGSTIYIAYQLARGERAGKVTAFIILTSRKNGEICYKDEDETVGSYERKCPKSILNLLTPLEELYPDGCAWAKEWRDECLANANKPKPAKITPGTVIKLKEPLNFSSVGIKTDKFTNIEKNRWTIGDTGYMTKFQAARYGYDIVS
jgi:hypothetical protein